MGTWHIVRFFEEEVRLCEVIKGREAEIRGRIAREKELRSKIKELEENLDWLRGLFFEHGNIVGEFITLASSALRGLQRLEIDLERGTLSSTIVEKERVKQAIKELEASLEELRKRNLLPS